MSSVTLSADEVIGSGESAYVILGELGRGASGVVYKARPVGQPDKLVALKLIEGFENLDTQLIEPEILSRLRHPNIIRLVDYFLVSGKLAVAMEYIDGPDLNGWARVPRPALLRRGPGLSDPDGPSPRLRTAQGVIHRDIKPGNIMVTKDAGKPRYILADFGVSRQVEGIQVKKQLAGSYRFMAPEQIRGRAISQSDLWSLGVVAYWLLTGMIPFNASTLRELSDQISLMTPPAPGTIVPDLDGELETIVLELIQKDPLRRIQSAEALLERLSEQPEPAAEAEATAARGIPPWEVKINRAIRRRKILFWTFLVLWMVPELVVGPALISLGAYNVYLHQARLRGAGRTVLGLLLIALGSFILTCAYRQAVRDRHDSKSKRFTGTG